jgi:hypothetical protein
MVTPVKPVAKVNRTARVERRAKAGKKGHGVVVVAADAIADAARVARS